MNERTQQKRQKRDPRDKEKAYDRMDLDELDKFLEGEQFLRQEDIGPKATFINKNIPTLQKESIV